MSEPNFFKIFKRLFLFIKNDQVQKQKKAWKMEKNYPIYMKIPRAHLQMVYKLSEKSMHPSLSTCGDKSCPRTGDRQTDRKIDRQGEFEGYNN